MSKEPGAHHLSKLLDLIEAEREAEREYFAQKMVYSQVKDRVAEGITWYPIVIDKSYYGPGGNLTVELSRTDNLETRHNFQGGSTIQVFINTAKEKNHTTIGVIASLRGNSMKIILNDDNLPDWFNEGKLGLNLMWDESTFDKMKSAVEFVRHQSKGRIHELKSIFYEKNEPAFDPGYALAFPGLNDSQNKALQKVAGAKDVSIIHGPPGTGKTTTLVKIIKYTVDSEKQVLACAPSNTAVDLLVEKLEAEGLKTLRIGHPARISEAAIQSSLDTKVSNHRHYSEIKGLRKKGEEFRRLAFKYKRSFGHQERQQRKLLKQQARQLFDEASYLERYIIQDLINNAEVIVATLAGVDNTYLKGKTYKTVFIDEAAQALEPACWIPISRSERVIMVGDHLQLPPTIKSAVAQKENLGYTLFERIIDQHSVDSMLTEQYRMDPDIEDWPNHFFYEGRLMTASNIHQRDRLSRPAVYIDTAGAGYEEEKDEESGSTRNNGEANFLIDYIIERLSEDESINNIGIIAPYRAQVELLNQLLAERINDNAPKIECHTVDGFQGQERDMIIISCTRSNAQGEIGFLKDLRRMNVALTRAQRALVIIGDSATLSSLPFFDQMVRYYQGKGWYQSVFEYD